MPAPYAYHLLAGIQIPRSLVWDDEFSWSSMARAHEYSITGALVVDAAPRLEGRPITLRGVADHGWMRRTALADLWALVGSAATAQTLTLADGRVFSVYFAPDDPIEATAVARAELPPDAYPYIVTIRLVTAGA